VLLFTILSVPLLSLSAIEGGWLGYFYFLLAVAMAAPYVMMVMQHHHWLSKIASLPIDC